MWSSKIHNRPTEIEWMIEEHGSQQQNTAKKMTFSAI